MGRWGLLRPLLLSVCTLLPGSPSLGRSSVRVSPTHGCLAVSPQLSLVSTPDRSVFVLERLSNTGGGGAVRLPAAAAASPSRALRGPVRYDAYGLSWIHEPIFQAWPPCQRVVFVQGGANLRARARESGHLYAAPCSGRLSSPSST